MYTFEITDKNGKCTEYKHIIKVSYTAPIPGEKETIIEGEDLFTHKYKNYYDLYLYSENESFTIFKNVISAIKVTKEN